MTNQQVHEAVVRWLAALLGITVIKSHQSADRPDLPYAMVDLANFRELEDMPSQFKHRELETTNTEGNREVEVTPVVEIEWTFLVFTYGDSCEEKLRRVLSAVHLSQLQEPLRPQLTIHEVGQVNSVPELIGERWEPRAQVNLMLRGISSDGYVIDTIEEHTPFTIETMERT